MSTSLSATTFSQRGHLCLPFETDAEKRDAVLSFVHEGLSRGARCVFTGSGEEFEELCRALDVLGDSADRAIARGALDLRTHEDTYLVGGVFDPIALIERTESLVDEALRNGSPGCVAPASCLRRQRTICGSKSSSMRHASTSTSPGGHSRACAGTRGRQSRQSAFGSPSHAPHGDRARRDVRQPLL